jgi:site-specific recombinase XerD
VPPRGGLRAVQALPRRDSGQPHTAWDRAVALVLQEERLAGRREPTLSLHRQSLAAVRRDLDAAGAPNAPAAIRRQHRAATVLSVRARARAARTISLRLQSLRQLFAFLRGRGELGELRAYR